MVEKLPLIKNPLTIIAMFAAIAEISGTVVLPFVAPQNQATYIWFLMTFPSFLVCFFFLTLNFNHSVLYAPSDYKDEQNFVRSLPRATYAEKALQVEKELEEEEEEEEEQEVVTPATPTVAANSNSRSSAASLARRRIRRSYAMAEESIFKELTHEFSNEIQREVRLRAGNASFIFDGIVREQGVTVVIEILPLHVVSRARVRTVLSRISTFLGALPDQLKESIRLLLAVVIGDSTVSEEAIREVVESCRTEVPFPIELRLYQLSHLEGYRSIDADASQSSQFRREIVS